MREFIISSDSSNQRLDRFIKKLLPKIPPELIQKSIRKKNITVNRKKAKANQLLKDNDKVEIYFSDETIDKFKKTDSKRKIPESYKTLVTKPSYEDENFIVINKPAGLLTQPDKSGDVSVSDVITEVQKNNNSTFSPAPLNRLDRNTSGIIIVPKNYQTQKLASELIREHQTTKKYLTLVKGDVRHSGNLVNGYLKDRDTNTARLDGDTQVELSYRPIESNGEVTLLEVELITGKSHQIRVQLSQAGFPIVGDRKYGERELNDYFRNMYHLDHQLLHASHYILYNNSEEILNVNVELPVQFREILKGELNL